MKITGIFLIIIVLIITLSNIAVFVQNNNGIPDIFQHFYPERFVDKEQELALKTLQAPFAAAENAAQPVQIASGITYDPLGNSIVISRTLNVPHRNEATISKWVVKAVSEILTFTITDYPTHKQQKLTQFMDQNAINELHTFMDTSNILSLMQAKNYELRSFIKGIPELRTSSAIDGRFRWVYDVPVSLSFLPAGSNIDYEKLDKSAYRLEELTFRIQLGRVKQGGNEGVIIETWETLKRKAQKK